MCLLFCVFITHRQSRVKPVVFLKWTPNKPHWFGYLNSKVARNLLSPLFQPLMPLMGSLLLLRRCQLNHHHHHHHHSHNLNHNSHLRWLQLKRNGCPRRPKVRLRSRDDVIRNWDGLTLRIPQGKKRVRDCWILSLRIKAWTLSTQSRLHWYNLLTNLSNQLHFRWCRS